jgi:hypothetical protein
MLKFHATIRVHHILLKTFHLRCRFPNCHFPNPGVLNPKPV